MTGVTALAWLAHDVRVIIDRVHAWLTGSRGGGGADWVCGCVHLGAQAVQRVDAGCGRVLAGHAAHHLGAVAEHVGSAGAGCWGPF